MTLSKTVFCATLILIAGIQTGCRSFGEKDNNDYRDLVRESQRYNRDGVIEDEGKSFHQCFNCYASDYMAVPPSIEVGRFFYTVMAEEKNEFRNIQININGLASAQVMFGVPNSVPLNTRLTQIRFGFWAKSLADVEQFVKVNTNFDKIDNPMGALLGDFTGTATNNKSVHVGPQIKSVFVFIPHEDSAQVTINGVTFTKADSPAQLAGTDLKPVAL